MATDAQGRQLSDDGYYYWDGTDWIPVAADAASAAAASAGNADALNQRGQELGKKAEADPDSLSDEEWAELESLAKDSTVTSVVAAADE